MTKKKVVKRPMTPEHKAKLQQKYWARQRAKEAGIHIPTRKEEREAAKAAKASITEQSVNQLVTEAPATEENTRINTPVFFKPGISVDNVKHPMRFRDCHENFNK